MIINVNRLSHFVNEELFKLTVSLHGIGNNFEHTEGSTKKEYLVCSPTTTFTIHIIREILKELKIKENNVKLKY